VCFELDLIAGGVAENPCLFLGAGAAAGGGRGATQARASLAPMFCVFCHDFDPKK
jgi:hypothetical protein